MKKYNSITQEQFENKVKEHNANLEIISEYHSLHSPITYKCKTCGFSETIQESNSLYRGATGCAYCNDRKLIVGVNDLKTSRPDLVKYFVNKEETTIYKAGSANKCLLKCPFCGNEKYMSVNKLSQRGFSCNQCGDGFSYPERFMYNLLTQLQVQFETEVVFGWSNKRYRYDFVYKNIIIEMDGGFHTTDNSLNGKTKEMSKETDDIKDALAKEHGYTMIRVDCTNSDYEYIKNNVLKSELSNVFDLSVINWLELENTITNMNSVKEVSEEWSKHVLTNKQIGDKFHIGWQKVQKCLKTASRLGIIEYDTKASSSGKYITAFKQDKGNEVVCLTDGKIFRNGKEAEIYYCLNKDAVGQVCRGEKLTTHGLEFDFTNTTKEIQDNKNRMKASNEKPSHSAKKVMCVETEEIYQSASECSKLLGFGKGYVSGIILSNKSVNGLHFKYI